MDERILKMRKIARENGEPVLRNKSFDLLIRTAELKKPCSVLEIGVNIGLSGIAVLLSCPSAKLTGIEIDEEKAAIAKGNYELFGVSERAKIFVGDASEIIPLLSGKYDFIFLDGPKGHYAEYCDNLIGLLSVGGIFFADNVLYRGYLDKGVKVPHRHATIKHSLENFLHRINGDKSLKTVLYDLEDGVSVTEKLYERN